MKKILLVLFMFLILPIHCTAKESALRGGVVYTVESARKLAFSGLDLKLDKSLIKPYYYDENRDENLLAIKEGRALKDRYIMEFSSGIVKGYAVTYNDKPEYAYYYTKGGYLAGVDYNPQPDRGEYPYKIGKYNAFGSIISVGLYVSDDEQFSYSKNGKLLAHWIGDNGFNEKGKLIAKRKVVEEIPNDNFTPSKAKESASPVSTKELQNTQK